MDSFEADFDFKLELEVRPEFVPASTLDSATALMPVTASKPASGPFFEPAFESASESAFESASESASEPASEPASESASEFASEPVPEPVSEIETTETSSLSCPSDLLMPVSLAVPSTHGDVDVSQEPEPFVPLLSLSDPCEGDDEAEPLAASAPAAFTILTNHCFSLREKTKHTYPSSNIFSIRGYHWQY